MAQKLLKFTKAGKMAKSGHTRQRIKNSELDERLALNITTNLKFADWVQVFGDERLTAALLDRLTHHAHIIELLGESYRFRQRAQGQHAE